MSTAVPNVPSTVLKNESSRPSLVAEPQADHHVALRVPGSLGGRASGPRGTPSTSSCKPVPPHRLRSSRTGGARAMEQDCPRHSARFEGFAARFPSGVQRRGRMQLTRGHEQLRSCGRLRASRRARRSRATRFPAAVGPRSRGYGSWPPSTWPRASAGREPASGSSEWTRGRPYCGGVAPPPAAASCAPAAARWSCFREGAAPSRRSAFARAGSLDEAQVPRRDSGLECEVELASAGGRWRQSAQDRADAGFEALGPVHAHERTFAGMVVKFVVLSMSAQGPQCCGGRVDYPRGNERAARR